MLRETLPRPLRGLARGLDPGVLPADGQLPYVELADGLDIAALMARKGDAGFAPAACRWLCASRWSAGRASSNSAGRWKPSRPSSPAALGQGHARTPQSAEVSFSEDALSRKVVAARGLGGPRWTHRRAKSLTAPQR